jgi:DNA-binding LytR/AlgR family response regulator
MIKICLITLEPNTSKWKQFSLDYSQPISIFNDCHVIDCEREISQNKKALILLDTDNMPEELITMYLKQFNSSYLVIIDPLHIWASLIIRNQNDFQVNDYVQKIENAADLESCIERCRKSLEIDQTDMVVGEYFVVKDRGESTFINLNNITVLEGLGAYTKVHSVNKQYIVSKNLKKLLEQLPKCFIRTHRSFAVHIKHINSLSGNQVLLHNGETVKASKSGKKILISRFSIA